VTIKNPKEVAMVLELRQHVTVARSYANRRLPRRVVDECRRRLMDVEESLADAYYHRRGLWTTGIDPDMHGAGAGSELMGYVPTRWRSLHGLFRHWPITSNDVLLDYGSGKGRTVVWAAANYRFRRIIGIELDRRLIDFAKANLARRNGRTLCDEVEFLQVDATEYDVPDDVTIIFFGNPFVGAIFEKVMGKVQESLVRNPRELAVLYYHPKMHETLINAGFTIEQQRTFQPNDWAIYRYAK
jgi:precorrin-6B methylase 2